MTTRADHPNGRFGSRWTLTEIAALASSLPPGEADVARTLLERPAEAAEWSVAELAAAAGTSRATVVRACQSLGFTGFRELRRLLRTSTNAQGPPPESELRDSDAPPDVLAKVIAASVRQLEHAAATASPSAFADAVERVVGARRVLVVASGSVAGLCTYTALRLTLAGRPAEAPGEFTSQYVAARGLDARDVLLAIANTGSSRPVVDCARVAGDAGAAVVAVTSFRRSPLGDLATTNLVAGVSEQEWRALRANLIALLDALHIAVSLALGAAAARVMSDLMSNLGPLTSRRSS